MLGRPVSGMADGRDEFLTMEICVFTDWLILVKMMMCFFVLDVSLILLFLCFMKRKGALAFWGRPCLQ